MLLWLWYRLAAAAPIQSLAWEFPYAVGVAVEHPIHALPWNVPYATGGPQKNKKKKKKKKNRLIDVIGILPDGADD